jgi:hypothetical protein
VAAAEALAEVEAAAGVEEVAELAVLEELEDELLHAVAASPTQAMAAKAAIRAPRR